MNTWNLDGMVICHRLGLVPSGEASVIIKVASAHRQEAFEACSFLIHELKSKVPIWKKQFTEEGSAWVAEGGRPSGQCPDSGEGSRGP